MPQTIIADIDRDLLAALDARAGLLTLRAILLRYKASGVTAAQVAALLHELRPATQEGPLEDVPGRRHRCAAPAAALRGRSETCELALFPRFAVHRHA